MLISESKKFLYFHLYKVAGTSVRECLRPYCSPKQIIFQNFNYGLSILGLKLNSNPLYEFHPKLQDVKLHLGSSFEKYYKFTFVRHPLDWQKSLYFFMQKNTRHHQHNLISKFTFDEYIKWRIDKDKHLISDLIFDLQGNPLLDEVYRFEDIENEFKKLCLKLGISASLPHKNIAGKGKKVQLQDSTLKEFKQAFKRDFINFNYN